MSVQTEASVDRALVREMARVGNLLRQLTDAVQRGALCGRPADAHEVLCTLSRIEHGLETLGGLESER